MSGLKLARRELEGLEPRMPAVDAAQRTLQQRLSAVENVLAIAMHRAEDDEECVHQLRVASRRADAALKIFESFVKAKPLRKARKALKRIRRAAGAARAHDVQLHLLHELAAPEGQDDQSRNAVLRELMDARQRDRGDGLRLIRSAAEEYNPRKLARLQESLLKSLTNIDLDQEQNAAGVTAAMPFASMARARLAQFTADVRQAAERVKGETDVPYADLHALRIRVKRLRYAMEVFAACYADGLKEEYRRIETMQDDLGEINDLFDLADSMADATASDLAKTFAFRTALEALHCEVARKRDERSSAFIAALKRGEWDDVVNFQPTETSETPLFVQVPATQPRFEVRG